MGKARGRSSGMVGGTAVPRGCLIVGSTPPRPSGTPESSRAGEREYEFEREH